MYQVVRQLDAIASQPLDIAGVSIRILDGDPANGCSQIVTRMAPGAVIPRHWHSKADETVYVLDGDFVEEGVSYGPGTFFSGDAGTSHGPHSTVTGCLLFTSFSDALDFMDGDPR